MKPHIQILHCVVLACLLPACDRSTVEKAPADTEPVAAPVERAPKRTFAPPPERLSIPPSVLALRHAQHQAGRFITEEMPDGTILRAFGVNLCQTGWMVQAFFDGPDGNLQATPAFLIERQRLTGEPFEYHPEGVTGSLWIDFAQFGFEYVRGTLTLRDEEGKDSMTIKVDAEPIGIATGAGLGKQGCYTTGYFELMHETHNYAGFVSGVYDGKELYFMSFRLDERHSVTVLLSLKRTQLAPENLIRADLGRIHEAPERFPIRVIYEVREDDPTPAPGQPSVRVQMTSAEEGRIAARFARSEPEGPVRVQIDDLPLPDWEGPFASETVSFRAEALFVTDQDGPHVPVSSRPQWGEFAKSLEEDASSSPDAPSHGSEPDSAP